MEDRFGDGRFPEILEGRSGFGDTCQMSLRHPSSLARMIFRSIFAVL